MGLLVLSQLLRQQDLYYIELLNFDFMKSVIDLFSNQMSKFVLAF